MKTFSSQAAQGDVWFRRVTAIPKSAKPRKDDGPVIVAHSETGHHHAFPKDSGAVYYETGNPMVAYLRLDSPSALEHHREHDTHESFGFEAGCYELRRPREYVDPEESRMVAD